MIPILVLAAGRSSRMKGGDKLSETIDGVPLLTRAAEAALACGGPVYVTLPPPPHPRYALIAGLDLTRVPVARASEGMAESLKAGLAALPEDAEGVLLHLADMPDLGHTAFDTVLRARVQHPDALAWRGADAEGTPGHPVLFSKDLLPRLSALTGDEGARSVVQEAREKTVLVPLPGSSALTDLDTPEAWAAWRAEHGKPH